MKHYLKILFFVLFPAMIHAQENSVESLKNSLSTTPDDSTRYFICRRIYDFYEEINRDSALHYAELAIAIAKRNGQKLAEATSIDNKAYQLIGMGRYAEALNNLFIAFNLSNAKMNDNAKSWPVFTSYPFKGDNRLLTLCYTHHIYGVLMWQTDNQEEATSQFREARRIAFEIKHPIRQSLADMNLARQFSNSNKLDSALLMAGEAEQIALEAGFKKYLGQVYQIISQTYFSKGEADSAKKYCYMGIEVSKAEKNQSGLSTNYFTLVDYYLKEKRFDSCIKYAMLNLTVNKSMGAVTGRVLNIGTVYEKIYRTYLLSNKKDSIYKYLGLAFSAKDSLYKIRIQNLTAYQIVLFNEQLRLQNLEKEKVVYQNKIRSYFFIAGIGVLLLLALIFYRNNRQKHKAKMKIEKAYEDLKATQQQLIQSEKMASLGELTAGIAHEIQNPLNFVNNFSDVSNELLDEMKTELNNGNMEEAKAIAEDVKQNLEKILHHGKRADSIVKGMLQHSRSSSGQKEPTDINALADEYLRLAFHGLRAKDKSFHAKFETHLDPSIEKINVVPQELGRVILNLINNAFYAVSERKKKNEPGYEPTVTITTKKENGRIEVKVRDNGTGIPPKVLEKIFQPFFTTKPTGQGTGLGLSLSYDIITKGHGGELKVETKEGGGTEFIINLPEK
jgi:signal transduction histidine kinase